LLKETRELLGKIIKILGLFFKFSIDEKNHKKNQ
jgi:hypothetical protein